MASYDNMAGLRIHDWNPIQVYPESWECPLGVPKTGHGLFSGDQRPMAYLWWTEPKAD